MEINVDELMLEALRNGIREGIKQQLNNSYSSNPLVKVIESAVAKKRDALADLLGEAIALCLDSEEFRKDFQSEVRRKIAGSLITKFGGEIEKHANALKSDPTTRARLTVAIDDLIRQAGKS